MTVPTIKMVHGVQNRKLFSNLIH